MNLHGFRAAAGASALLAGCAQGAYPSLAVRPAERITQSATSVPGPSPAATPLAVTPLAGADLGARLNALLRGARGAHAAFLAQRAATTAATEAAKGAAPASDPWSTAQQAISRLTAARGGTDVALSEILRIQSDDRVAHAMADGAAGYADGAPAGARADAAAIAAARDEVSEMIATEEAALADLRGRLAD